MALCFRESSNIKALDIILSVGLGILAIYTAHSFLIIDICLDMGGSIDKTTGSCIDENYHEQYIVISPVLLAVYFVIGMLVSLISAFIIKAIRGAKND